MDNLIYIHIASAFLSLTLLIVRGLMQLKNKDWRAIKLLKILPHLSDTLLICSGVVLLFNYGYGFPVWIMIKFILLILYIIFSIKTFSKKNTTPNSIAFILACLAFSGAILVGYYH